MPELKGWQNKNSKMKASTELVIIPGGFFLYKVKFGKEVEYSHSKHCALKEIDKRLKTCNIIVNQ